MTRNPPVKVQIGPYYTYSVRFGQKKCRNALYDTGNTLFPRGRNCGKSATDGVMRVDAARKKAKMREIVDASAVRMH